LLQLQVQVTLLLGTFYVEIFRILCSCSVSRSFADACCYGIYIAFKTSNSYGSYLEKLSSSGGLAVV